MKPRVIIAGGYGLVGGLAARRLRAAGLDIDLVLAGRHPEKGAALAAELGAEVLGLDVMSPSESLAAAGPFDLLVAALQDPGDALLTATLKAGAAHIGIVRTADSMASTAIAASALARRPALMLGHWQAGVMTMAALDAARHLARIDRIDLAALYDYADPIGPMTVADSGGFLGKALVRQQGLWVNLDAAASGRAVVRGAGLPDFEGQPMGVLDTPGLAAMTGAHDVRFDLGAGQSLGSAAGGCASHDLYIDLSGVTAWGEEVTQRTVVSDPRGQAHLTALGILIGVERVLGLDGRPPPPAGLAFPESTLDPARAVRRLRDFGVSIERVS